MIRFQYKTQWTKRDVHYSIKTNQVFLKSFKIIYILFCWIKLAFVFYKNKGFVLFSASCL